MRTIALVLAYTLACFAPSPAEACDPTSFPSRFELFDEADTVVVGRPTFVPKGEGDLVLAVDAVPKSRTR